MGVRDHVPGHDWDYSPEDVLDAIKNGDETRVHDLIRRAQSDGRGPNFASWAMHDGDWDTGEHTLLHWACDCERLNTGKPSLNIVKCLVEEGGFDVNARGQGSTVPLQLIAKRNGEEAARIIEYLLSRKADANARDEFGYAPLHQAAYHGSTTAARLLVQHGANRMALNSKRHDPRTTADRRRRGALDRGDDEDKKRFEEMCEILEHRDVDMEKDDVCSFFKGFLYYGNRDGKPKGPVRMTVKDMLDAKKLMEERPEQMKSDTRWFHLPANNREWFEKLVKAVVEVDHRMNRDTYEHKYCDRIENEVHAIMAETGSYTNSVHPARSYRAVPIRKEDTEASEYLKRYDYDGSEDISDGRQVVSFVSVPLIERDIYVGKMHGKSQDIDSRLPEGVLKRKKMMKQMCDVYTDDVFLKNTLDRYYYEGLDDSTIESRDRSQVFSKHACSGSGLPFILYVGQLWALWIGENTLITASQGDWTGADTSSPARRFAQRSSVYKTPRPADIFYELQELCVDLVNYHQPGDAVKDTDCAISAQEAFTREIAEISNGIKEQYERYMLESREIAKKNAMRDLARTIRKQVYDRGYSLHDKEAAEYPTATTKTEPSQALQSVLDQIRQKPSTQSRKRQVLDDIEQKAETDHGGDMVVTIRKLAHEDREENKGRAALDVRDDVGTEAEKLAQIVDVIDELNIINMVLGEQYEMARWSMSKKDVRNFVRDVRPSFRELLEESERVRQSIVELLGLRQQEISITNAVETALGADKQASTKLAATVFTVINFIYTPFGFTFTILGSGIRSLSGQYSVGTAILTMVLTLLATIALLIILLPVLTAVKTPWNNWVLLVTKHTKKLLPHEGEPQDAEKDYPLHGDRVQASPFAMNGQNGQKTEKNGDARNNGFAPRLRSNRTRQPDPESQ